MPASIEIRAEAGADDPFFDHRKFCRQGAGPQQNGEVIGLLHAEIAADLTGAAKDRLANDGRRDHLLVKDDRKWQADIFLRNTPEALRPGGIEAEGDDRLIGALIEAWLRVDEILAAHQRLPLDHVRHRRLVRRVNQFAVGRCGLGASDLRGVRGVVDELEIKLSGLADQSLQPLDIADARHLYKNAVPALPLDARLRRAKRIHTPPNGFDRSLDARTHALDEPGLGRLQNDVVVVAAADLESICRRQAAKAAAHWNSQLAELRKSLLEIRAFTNLDRNRIRATILPEIAVRETSPPKSIAHIVANALEEVVGHLLLVELIEQMRAALQVQSQIHLPMRKPTRHRIHAGAREEIGKREQEAGEQDDAHQNDLPSRKLQHRRSRPRKFAPGGQLSGPAASCCYVAALALVPAAASPLLLTSEIVPRRILMRTPSAISTCSS